MELTGASPSPQESTLLAERLSETLTALERVMGGEVETVLDTLGRPMLLRSAQDALVQSQRRHRRLLSRMPGLVFELGPDGRILFVNEAITTLTGYQPGELAGRCWWETFFADPGDPAARAARDALTGGDVRDLDVRMVSRGGAELLLSVTTANHRREDGALERIVAFGVDVTERREERRRAEEDRLRLVEEQARRKAVEASALAIRESEERHRTLFESSPHPLLLYDVESLAILAVNEAAVTQFGCTRAEFLELTIKDLRSSADALERLAALQRPTHLGVWTLQRRDGARIDMDLTASPLTVGSRAARLVFAVDVTERRRAEDKLRATEEQLRQAQKMEVIGQLAGGIAHDFNNLMTAVIGFSDLLLARLPDEDPTRKMLGHIRRAGQRATGLTQQLLAFSRKQVLQPRVLDLSAVVAEATPLLRQLIGEDVELVSTPTAGLRRIRADPGQLEQVIVNLCVNARDAIHEGKAPGRITIETKNVELGEEEVAPHGEVVAGPYVLLAVTDTGAGMDPATVARMFEPFFTTKRQGKGTGLGLSVVYGIVKQSGGHIWIDSVPGQGTRFAIHFPVHQLQDPPDPPSFAAKRRQSEARGTETVLVVEDEESVREFVIAALLTRGYQVLEAASGTGALRVAEQFRGEIQLVLTDLVMPLVGGRALVEQLKGVIPETKVLFMSGYAEDLLAHGGALDPGLEFLAKPFTPVELSAKVRDVLDGAASCPQEVQIRPSSA